MTPLGSQESFFDQMLDDAEVPTINRALAEVGVVALAGLVAGRHDPRPRVQTIASLADRCTKVQSKARSRGFAGEFAVGRDELLGLRVDLGGVARQEGCEKVVGVYFKSGYSRSMQFGVRMPARRRYASAFPCW